MDGNLDNVQPVIALCLWLVASLYWMRLASACCSGDVDPRKAVQHNSAVLEASNGGMCAENSP